MANPAHLEILSQGISVWNAWRKANESIRPDLSDAHFIELGAYKEYHLDKLSGILLNGSNLHGCHINGAILDNADLTGADLSEAVLGAVSLKNAILTDANCSKTVLTYTLLQGTVFIRTDLRGANLSNSTLYDTLMWNIQIDTETLQNDLAVADNNDKFWVQVDGLGTAQLIYLAFKQPDFFYRLNINIKSSILIIANFGRMGQAFLEDYMEEMLPALIRQLGFCPIMLDTASIVDTNQLLKLIKILSSITEYIIIDMTELNSLLSALNKVLSTFDTTKIQAIVNEKFYTPDLVKKVSSYAWAQPIYQYKTRDIIAIDTVRDIMSQLSGHKL